MLTNHTRIVEHFFEIPEGTLSDSLKTTENEYVFGNETDQVVIRLNEFPTPFAEQDMPFSLRFSFFIKNGDEAEMHYFFFENHDVSELHQAAFGDEPSKKVSLTEYLKDNSIFDGFRQRYPYFVLALTTEQLEQLTHTLDTDVLKEMYYPVHYMNEQREVAFTNSLRFDYLAEKGLFQEEFLKFTNLLLL